MAGIQPITKRNKASRRKGARRLKDFRDLRSFMGAIYQINRFIPNLADLCAPLRPLLKKENEWTWGDENEEAFPKIKQAIKETTEIKHFKRDSPLRINCDACKESLGAFLQQQQEEEW